MLAACIFSVFFFLDLQILCPNGTYGAWPSVPPPLPMVFPPGHDDDITCVLKNDKTTMSHTTILGHSRRFVVFFFIFFINSSSMVVGGRKLGEESVVKTRNKLLKHEPHSEDVKFRMARLRNRFF